MRIIFAGTPGFAAVVLAELIGGGHEVVLVLTQPDRPAGRGLVPRASEVKVLGLQHGLTVVQPESLRKEEGHHAVVQARADVMVVAAYGMLLPRVVLDSPRFGCVNIHASLLPRWRGAAPIQRAILAGDSTTGISIMRMDQGLDTGPILMQRSLSIESGETAGTLHDRLAQLGARCLREALPKLACGELLGVAQDDALACHAAKISRDDARIDWNASAPQIERTVRALNPAPCAQTVYSGAAIKVWRAQAGDGAWAVPGTVVSVEPDAILVACGSGVLRLLELQRAGGRRVPVNAYLRGSQISPGERFGP